MMMSIRSCAACLVAVFGGAAVATAAEKPPIVGGVAKDFELPALTGGSVKLSQLTDSSPVVLVVLRGYPGYQCPICTKQVSELIAKANDFKAAGAKVVFIYPGAANQLKAHASEFVKGKDYPEHFQFLLDPDYTFTNAYGLRWDARGETAYPSTFVLDKSRTVTFAKVSTGHGDRSKVADVVKAVSGK